MHYPKELHRPGRGRRVSGPLSLSPGLGSPPSHLLGSIWGRGFGPTTGLLRATGVEGTWLTTVALFNGRKGKQAFILVLWTTGNAPASQFLLGGRGVLGNISCFACRSWARLGLFPEKFSSFLEAANLHCKNSGPHGISSACLGTWGRAVKSRAVSALLGAPSESIETPGASAVPSPCAGLLPEPLPFCPHSPPAGCRPRPQQREPGAPRGDGGNRARPTHGRTHNRNRSPRKVSSGQQYNVDKGSRQIRRVPLVKALALTARPPAPLFPGHTKPLPGLFLRGQTPRPLPHLPNRGTACAPLRRGVGAPWRRCLGGAPFTGGEPAS